MASKMGRKENARASKGRQSSFVAGIHQNAEIVREEKR